MIQRIVVTLLLLTSVAAAAQSTIRWSSTVPVPPCPTQTEFEDALAARLGQPFAHEELDIRVELRWSLRGGQVEGEFLAFGRDGQTLGKRKLTGRLAECPSLSGALADTLAQVFRQRLAETQEKRPAVKNAAEIALPVSSEAPSHLPQQELSASLRGLAFSIPLVGVGMSVGYGWRFASFRFQGEAFLFAGYAGPYWKGNVLSVIPALHAFAAASWRAWDFGAELAVGAYVASGVNFKETRTAVQPWLTLGPRIDVQPFSSYASFRLIASLSAELVRHTWVIDQGTLWASPGISASLGCSWRFGP